MPKPGHIALNAKRNLGVLVEQNGDRWQGVSLEEDNVGGSWSSKDPEIMGHVSQLRDLVRGYILQ